MYQVVAADFLLKIVSKYRWRLKWDLVIESHAWELETNTSKDHVCKRFRSILVRWFLYTLVNTQTLWSKTFRRHWKNSEDRCPENENIFWTTDVVSFAAGKKYWKTITDLYLNRTSSKIEKMLLTFDVALNAKWVRPWCSKWLLSFWVKTQFTLYKHLYVLY